jgi:hypothetical protein
MRKILKRLGLIVNLEYKSRLSIDKTKKLLLDDSLDKKLLMIDNLLGSKRPIKSTDIKIEENSFHIEKKAVLNPLSGRGKIIGKIHENQTGDSSITCEIFSNYKDFWFVLFAAMFLLILWVPFVVFGKYGYEWLAYLIAFFTLLTTSMIFFQRYEVKKLRSDLDSFITRLNINN